MGQNVDNVNVKGASDKVPEPPPSTRDRLLAAAAHLLDEGGPEAVTLRAVAQAVGVSHNAPYRHFDDKRALLAAVAQEGFRELGAAFAHAAETAATPLAALKLVVRLYFDFARRHPARYRLLFSDPEVGREGGGLETEALRAFGAVAGLVEAAQRSGELKQGDPAELTALLYGAVHGLADLELSGRARAAKGMETVDALPVILLDLLATGART
jgi:AcrR family transcriptional regulator